VGDELLHLTRPPVVDYSTTGGTSELLQQFISAPVIDPQPTQPAGYGSGSITGIDPQVTPTVQVGVKPLMVVALLACSVQKPTTRTISSTTTAMMAASATSDSAML
jgi:hypothetical protein